MRIEMRLLDAAGALIWNSLIEESIDNLFAVQERIAAGIANRLGAGENTIPVETVAAQRCWMPADLTALEKYYTARYLTELRTETDEARVGLRQAIELYKELIGEYPQFAEAYAGLAWAYGYQTAYDKENAIPDQQKESNRLSKIALRHCPTLGEALHLIANQYDHENPWIGQYQQLTAFIDMEPHKTEYYQRLSRHYRDTGNRPRSLDVAKRNYGLNPLSVRSVKELAMAHLHVEDYDKAIEMFELATALGSTSPNFAVHMRESADCGHDVECQMEALPPYMKGRPSVERLRIVLRVPSNDFQATESRAMLESSVWLH